MNCEQAASLLDAYMAMNYAVDADGNSDAKAARKALRSVIIDAMTNYKVEPSYPSITLNGRGVAIPTNWDGSPKVTCSGLDPAFGYTTCAMKAGE